MKKRNLMMASGALAILFTGFPHVWSIYQPYVMRETGWALETVSICFYLPTLFFVFGNIIGGKLYDQGHAKKVLGMGGIIFSGGMVLAAATLGIHPMITYATLGTMQGIGQGMIYAVILATAQKWFPNRAGFASGVVITANGLCGFLISPFSKILLSRGGVRFALTVIGVFIAISAAIAVIFVNQPEKEIHGIQQDYGEIRQYTSKEMVQTKKFYYLMGIMMCSLMPYYLVSPISQTLQLERGVEEAVAIGSVMAGSVLNALMRLVLPAAADRIGRIFCIQGILCAAIAAMMFLLSGSKSLTTAAIIMAYGCFGGIMGSFPSLSSSIFGLKYAGQNYGIIMFGIIIVTVVSPMITKIMYALGFGFMGNFAAGTMFGVVAFILSIKLKKEINDKQKEGSRRLCH